METEEMTMSNVNQGLNIKLSRAVNNVKQETLAEKMGLTQSAISKHENSAVLDDELLEKYAEALGVSVEFLKTWEQGARNIVFESVTNNDNATGVNYTGTLNNNPLDKVTELYERLLKEKDEKYSTLERRIQNLEKLLSER